MTKEQLAEAVPLSRLIDQGKQTSDVLGHIIAECKNGRPNADYFSLEAMGKSFATTQIPTSVISTAAFVLKASIDQQIAANEARLAAL